MINKSILIVFLVLLVSSLMVLASDNYNQTGNNDKFFQQGIGFFNENLAVTTLSTKTLGTPRLTPLVADLDNDGINEIIQMDDATVRLFTGINLDIVDSFTLEGFSFLDHMITFDIDGDGFTEIIASDQTNNHIYILKYNGTNFFNLSTITMDSQSDQEVMLQCRSTQDCIAVTTNDTNSDFAFYNAFTFSETTRGPLFFSNIFDAGGRETSCFPKIKEIVVANYDQDADDEFIFSMIDGTAGGSDEQAIILYLNASAVGTITQEQIILASSIGTNMDAFLSGASDSCSTGASDVVSNFGKYITSPMVFDIDSAPGNGLETVIGFSINLDVFKINSFRSTGALFDRYPLFFTADGEIVSNMMRANIFSDTGNNDFCVMGYDKTAQELDLLCATEQTSFQTETLEFRFDFANTHNITTDYGIMNSIAHTGQHSSATEDIGEQGENNNPSEIISSYGVFKVEDDTSNGSLFTKTLTRIFPNPKADAVVIPVDTEKIGRDDLLVMQQTNLWYIDDGFTNTPGQITEYQINPCVDSTWKQNTSVEVNIKVEDVDGDDVSARSILYDGDPNEANSGFSVNSTTGTTFSFGFIANKTIGSSTLTLQGRDVENAGILDEIILAFSVGPNGVETNDCTTLVTIGLDPEIPAEEITPETDLADNSITSGINTIADLFNIGGLFVYFVFMLAVALGVWFSVATERSPITSLGAIIIFMVLLLIMGTLLGIVPFGIMLAVMVSLIAAVALWFSRLVNNSSNV